MAGREFQVSDGRIPQGLVGGSLGLPQGYKFTRTHRSVTPGRRPPTICHARHVGLECTPAVGNAVQEMGAWTPKFWVATHLVDALLAGPWTITELQLRAEAVLGPSQPEALAALIAHLTSANPAPYAPSPDRLRRLLLSSPDFDLAAERAQQSFTSVLPELQSQPFAPIDALRGLPHRPISTTGDLAEWLSLTAAELEWFADTRRLQSRARAPELQHYTFAWLPKRRGPPRLLEAPKARLKVIQRKILREILDAVPAHPAAHGFVKGRSCISAASPHAGEELVVTLDLKDYFLMTPLARAHGLFRSLGYPWKVTRYLTSLCSVSTPDWILVTEPPLSWTTRQLYRSRHIPQGAPTSPAIANLCSYRFDARLSGFARASGLRYSRYADDLVFSGDRLAPNHRQQALHCIGEIVENEGYRVNPAKTKIQPSSARQTVMGIVVNKHTNLDRTSFDQLKATLFNCVRHGAQSQNKNAHPDFRAHIEGRVGWAEQLNPQRGRKLRAVFDAIKW
jgi:RNA-directed DNA polymerase